MCKVCRGAGNVGVFPALWACGPCGGSGVLIQFAAPTIHVHPVRFDFWRKQAQKAARRAAAATPHQHGAGNGEKHGG